MSNISKIKIRGGEYDIIDNTAIHNVKTIGGTTIEGNGDIPFKTINGTTLLGSGDIQIQGGGGSTIDLSNYYTKQEINNKGYITADDISGKANSSDLAEVATSGSYTDLSDKPSIPTENYPVEIISGSMRQAELNPNTYYICEINEGYIEFSFTYPEKKDEVVCEYVIELRCGADVRDITFPGYIEWAEGAWPEFENGCKYVISVVNDKGVFAKF